MNETDCQKRLAEEVAESDGWSEVLRNFSQGCFSKLRCPHCDSIKHFVYLTHPYGITVSCRKCQRFIHTRGGRPFWLDDSLLAREEFRNVPETDCDGGQGNR